VGNAGVDVVKHGFKGAMTAGQAGMSVAKSGLKGFKKMFGSAQKKKK
jgi:hypothetical protein